MFTHTLPSRGGWTRGGFIAPRPMSRNLSHSVVNAKICVFFCLSNYYTTVICLSRHLGYEAGYHIYDGNILTLYTCNRSTRGVEFATLSCAMVRTHAALVIGCHRPDRARCCVAAAYKLTNMEIKRSLNLDYAKH